MIPHVVCSFIVFALILLDHAQVESDEDSQASQDSMIVHDMQDSFATEPNGQRNVESATSATEFQADWVPPWRIKAGRVPADQSKATVSEEPRRQPVPMKLEEPNFSESLPQPSNNYNSDKEGPNFSESLPPPTNSYDSDRIEERVPDSSRNQDSLSSAAQNQPWSKRFASKEDLLKPHAPTPWRSEAKTISDTDDQATWSRGTKLAFQARQSQHSADE